MSNSTMSLQSVAVTDLKTDKTEVCYSPGYALQVAEEILDGTEINVDEHISIVVAYEETGRAINSASLEPLDYTECEITLEQLEEMQ